MREKANLDSLPVWENHSAESVQRHDEHHFHAEHCAVQRHRIAIEAKRQRHKIAAAEHKSGENERRQQVEEIGHTGERQQNVARAVKGP